MDRFPGGARSLYPLPAAVVNGTLTIPAPLADDSSHRPKSQVVGRLSSDIPRSSSDTHPAPLAEPAGAADAAVIAEVLAGDSGRFAELVVRYQPRIFALARRLSRREDEVADVVQEVFLKAFQKLGSFRGEAPFEHWLMRLATRTCYDVLRTHQKSREHHVADLSPEERDWLDTFAAGDAGPSDGAEAARTLVAKVFEKLAPAHRLVLTLLELEDRSIKEIAALTGWSIPLVKVRAFRARAEMRRLVERLARDKYL